MDPTIDPTTGQSQLYKALLQQSLGGPNNGMGSMIAKMMQMYALNKGQPTGPLPGAGSGQPQGNFGSMPQMPMQGLGGNPSILDGILNGQ